MTTIGNKIRQEALGKLKENPEGLRYSQLVNAVLSSNPLFKKNTVHGNVWNLDQTCPGEVYKPSRGLFRLTKYKEDDSEQLKPELIEKAPLKIKEEDFYEPFADWLQNDLEECTKAIALGGNCFRDKWGTPDVIGKRESKKSDIIAAPVEIISAEIKPDVNQLITAFGQACAYCIFSHKTYLVVPAASPQDEVARLDSLCQVFGIGLVLFEASQPNEPNFQIRVRAVKRDPDLFYANKYMKFIEARLFG